MLYLHIELMEFKNNEVLMESLKTIGDDKDCLVAYDRTNCAIY